MHDAPPFAGHALDADVECVPSLKTLLKWEKGSTNAPQKIGGVTSARQEIGGVRPRCGETVTLQATNEERSPVPAAG